MLPPADDTETVGVSATTASPASDEPMAGADAAAMAGDRGPHRLHLHWWLSLAIVALDQIAKYFVILKIPLSTSVHVINNLVDFTHVQNEGVAFGLLNDAGDPLPVPKWMITTALAALALVGIGLYARYIRHEEWLARVGLSLILGGAVGNLVDRVRAGHAVVDFVDVYFRGCGGQCDWHFWAFNVADASITIGAVLVFLDLLVVTRHASDSV